MRTRPPLAADGAPAVGLWILVVGVALLVWQPGYPFHRTSCGRCCWSPSAASSSPPRGAAATGRPSSGGTALMGAVVNLAVRRSSRR